MSQIFTVTRRELGSYFLSPVFWVIAGAFLLVSGLVFASYVMPSLGGQGREASMTPFIQLYGTIFLFVAPLLAMRLLSEEQKTGTLELLMTSPVRDWQVVVGKWLAAFLVSLVIVAFTLVHAFVMNSLSDNGLAMGPMWLGYLGLAMTIGALLAVGVLTSALTENQVVAAFLGIMAALVLWFLGFVSQSLANPDEWWAKSLGAVAILNHLETFNQGLLDTRHLLYFIVLTVGALYLATRVLESRRWR